MTMKQGWLAASTGMAVLVSGCNTPQAVPPQQAKNIIFMVPDGMGLADVTAARIFKNGPDGAPLAFEKLPQIGYQRTYSASSTVTDSAAAASAWATGEKYKNGQISSHGGDDAPETILEIAKKKGKATGLIATSTITHATPAAFGSHVDGRKSEGEIGRQFIFETRVDVLLGGDFGGEDPGALVASATNELGYAFAGTKQELAALPASATKLLGLFAPGRKGKTIEHFRVAATNDYPASEPTLAEMAQAALEVLSADSEGFFLLVEGSQVDWENHANRAEGMISEVLGFEAAVQAVTEWLDADPVRKSETLLIVVPDHETGGFAVNGPYGKLLKAGGMVETAWTTKQHTGIDTIVWSQGPGSEQLGRALDNTDLFRTMKAVLK